MILYIAGGACGLENEEMLFDYNRWRLLSYWAILWKEFGTDIGFNFYKEKILEWETLPEDVKKADRLKGVPTKIFIDSGAFSIYKRFSLHSKHYMATKTEEEIRKECYAHYETEEFWQYVDLYAQFIKDNQKFIEGYVNVDVIDEPELTYRVQNYLVNTHKLKPIPVIHSGNPLDRLERYLSDGYDYIGIGGMGHKLSFNQYCAWVDGIFNLVCDPKTALPRVKLHGFGMTTNYLLFRYPWYSVDSTTWKSEARYGKIFVPVVKNGKWDFFQRPMLVSISSRRKGKGDFFMGFDKISVAARKNVLRWLEELNLPLGEVEYKKVDASYKPIPPNERWVGNVIDEENKRWLEIVIKSGVRSDLILRQTANTHYYWRLNQEALLEWPAPFKHMEKLGLRFF